MAAYLSLEEALVAMAAGVSFSLALVAGWWAFNAYRTGRLRRGWQWLRVQALGGVTTLEHSRVGYNCSICQCRMDAKEKVRKLSCGHVFHCRGSEKCKEGIEKWLAETSMTCPVCREVPRTVWPWKARPPMSSAPSGSKGPAQPQRRNRRRTRSH